MGWSVVLPRSEMFAMVREPAIAPGVATLSSLDINEDERRRHHNALARLLDEWMADESGYDEETWPELMEALDRDRSSSRKLFRG